jgi:hypothetical protein
VPEIFALQRLAFGILGESWSDFLFCPVFLPMRWYVCIWLRAASGSFAYQDIGGVLCIAGVFFFFALLLFPDLV